MQQDLRFWGVVVKPGETWKCDPGELYYHLSQIALEDGKAKENVEVFVKTDDKRIMLCTLSVDNDPHFVTGLVFKKKFELLHTSMNSNICFTGYKFEIVDRCNTYTKGDDESDQEVPLLIPLDSNTDGYKNNEATHGSNKLTAPRPVNAPSSTPKATVEEPTSPPKPKGDDKDKTDAHNPSDSDDIETYEDVDYPQKKTKGQKRPVETPLKTPQGKKAKIETPTTGKNTGYVHVATPYPAKQASRTSGYVHVATPYPAKHARKAPESKDKSKQSTPHVCGSCSRTFGSPGGLKDHSKVKHGAE
ncbi:histone deacetylase HDT2-like isoform X2 [Lolium rigidum]|uniref:histone deacetylase HDT2-like isoform X2 n=1 Tax=Lolium rigidum TaxID=89674 RepID=UPI001F5DB532|nr:histone deacetylase HDT2-like isoform X2 [Lolium rigidum]